MEQRVQWNRGSVGTQEQWVKRYRGIQVQRNSGYKGTEKQLGHRNRGTLGTEEQWV